jgi:hypothetical protein
MPDKKDGLFVRYVSTPKGGGYRVVRKSDRDSSIIKVSYVDKNGVECKDVVEHKKKSIWSRIVDKVIWLFRWFAGRL